MLHQKPSAFEISGGFVNQQSPSGQYFWKFFFAFEILSEVLQGSLLEPLLFIEFIIYEIWCN
jgi:hypothetical protein